MKSALYLMAIVSVSLYCNVSSQAGEISGRMFDLPELGGAQIGDESIKLTIREVVDKNTTIEFVSFQPTPRLAANVVQQSGNTITFKGGEFGIQVLPVITRRVVLRIDFERSDGLRSAVTQSLNRIVIDPKAQLSTDLVVPLPDEEAPKPDKRKFPCPKSCCHAYHPNFHYCPPQPVYYYCPTVRGCW